MRVTPVISVSASLTTAVAQSKKHWPNLRNSTVHTPLDYFSSPLVVGYLFHSVEYFPLGWHVEGLEYKGKGGVVSGDPLDRGLQVEEAFLLDGGGQLGAEPGGQGGLVAHDTTTGLPD